MEQVVNIETVKKVAPAADGSEIAVGAEALVGDQPTKLEIAITRRNAGDNGQGLR